MKNEWEISKLKRRIAKAKRRIAVEKNVEHEQGVIKRLEARLAVITA